MTAVQQPTEIWNTMPGWGIHVDLTPVELLDSRRLRTVRRLIVAAFVLLLAGLGAADFLAAARVDTARTRLADEQTSNTRLQSQQRSYRGTVETENSINQIRTQLARLMARDVDVAAVSTAIGSRLPPGMTVAELGLSVTTDDRSGAGSAGSGGASNLDTSGQQHIGAVTLSGTARRMTDVSTLVDRLRTMNGVVEPYPTATQQTTKGVTFSVQLTLTDRLLTHRFDFQAGVK
jgi:hypothetical protein